MFLGWIYSELCVTVGPMNVCLIACVIKLSQGCPSCCLPLVPIGSSTRSNTEQESPSLVRPLGPALSLPASPDHDGSQPQVLS